MSTKATTRAGRRRKAPPPINAAQRRRLFALAGEKGFDLDDLRSFTPAGSISALTQDQAAELIDRLAGYRAAPRRGTITPGQLAMIEALRCATGYTPAALDRWISRMFRLPGLAAIQDRRVARGIIAGLRRIQEFRARPGGGPNVP